MTVLQLLIKTMHMHVVAEQLPEALSIQRALIIH